MEGNRSVQSRLLGHTARMLSFAFALIASCALIFLCWGFAPASRAYAAANESSPDLHVLVLCSYGFDWPATRVEIEGLSSNLPSYISTNYVFMDTKNVDPAVAESYTYDQVEKAQAKLNRYDAIITIDDDAFDFVIKHRNDLFAGVPVVFCGVNDGDKAQDAAAADGNMTGSSSAIR